MPSDAAKGQCVLRSCSAVLDCGDTGHHHTARLIGWCGTEKHEVTRGGT